MHGIVLSNWFGFLRQNATLNANEITQLRSKPSKKAAMEQKIKEAEIDQSLLEAKETKTNVFNSLRSLYYKYENVYL